MAKDRFGHGVNDGGTFMSRSLHSMVPQIAMMGGQAGVILATQMDTRRPAYTAMVKELKKMARPGLNFTSINTSASPFEPLINPAKGAHYQPQTNTVATAQRGTGTNPGTLAHEMGHAQQYGKGGTPRLNKMANYSRVANMFGLTMLPLMIADDEKSAKAFAGIGTALSAPNFIHEMDASAKGRKLLMDAASKSGNKLGFLKSLAPYKGIPSYLIALLAPVLLYKYLKSKGQYSKGKE